MRSALLGLMLLSVGFVCVGGANAGSRSDPLSGSWATAPVSMSTIRSDLLAAHFTSADVADYERELGFGDTTKVKFAFTFSRKGGRPHALQRFWDAAKGPSGGDDGFYKLLPGGKVAISSTHPGLRPWREVFSYNVRGNRLKLRFVNATNPKETAKQLRFDRVVMTAASIAPYVRGG